MLYLQRLSLIFNRKTLLVTVVAILATMLCIRFGLEANFPMTLIATAVVFPVVFSIHGAYERREQVLADYSSLKAFGRSLYLASRDWMDNPRPSSLERLRDLLKALFESIRTLLQGSKQDSAANEARVYRHFSELSAFIRDDQRRLGLAETEVSRCNQYLNQMIQAFESIKHIHQYRTPKTLKSFGDLFILLLPPVYGPYFAHMATAHAPAVVFAMPITFAVVLTALSNIQDQLENPFDDYGEDDVHINVDKFINSLV